MRKIEFDIKLRTKDLFLYTMYHTYFSISGVFGLLISIASFLFFLYNLGKVPVSTLCVLLMVALLFPVIQPVLLYGKCRKQIRKSKEIKDVLHYTLTGEDIEISQGENRAKVHWYDIRKAVCLKHAVYLYMSPVRAFIFPEDSCGSQFGAVIKLVKESMERYKDYEPEETEEGEDSRDFTEETEEVRGRRGSAEDSEEEEDSVDFEDSGEEEDSVDFEDSGEEEEGRDLSEDSEEEGEESNDENDME